MRLTLLYFILCFSFSFAQKQNDNSITLDELVKKGNFEKSYYLYAGNTTQISFKISHLDTGEDTVGLFIELLDTAQIRLKGIVTELDTNLIRLDFETYTTQDVQREYYKVVGKFKIISSDKKNFVTYHDFKIILDGKVVYRSEGKTKFRNKVKKPENMNLLVKRKQYRAECLIEKDSQCQLKLLQIHESGYDHPISIKLYIRLLDTLAIKQKAVISVLDTTLVKMDLDIDSYWIPHELKNKKYSFKGTIKIVSFNKNKIIIRQKIMVTQPNTGDEYYYGGKNKFTDYAPWD